jgi:hypothetical protein
MNHIRAGIGQINAIIKYGLAFSLLLSTTKYNIEAKVQKKDSKIHMNW